MNSVAPLSVFERMWLLVAAAFGSEEVLVFALLVVFAVACLLAVLWFVDALGGNDDAAT